MTTTERKLTRRNESREGDRYRSFTETIRFDDMHAAVDMEVTEYERRTDVPGPGEDFVRATVHIAPTDGLFQETVTAHHIAEQRKWAITLGPVIVFVDDDTRRTLINQLIYGKDI